VRETCHENTKGRYGSISGKIYSDGRGGRKRGGEKQYGKGKDRRRITNIKRRVRGIQSCTINSVPKIELYKKKGGGKRSYWGKKGTTEWGETKDEGSRRISGRNKDKNSENWLFSGKSPDWRGTVKRKENKRIRKKEMFAKKKK